MESGRIADHYFDEGPPSKKVRGMKSLILLDPKMTLDEAVDVCIEEHTHGSKGKFLGKGEQGAAYELGDRVIKVTTFQNLDPDERQRQMQAWEDEGEIGKALGDKGLAPTIYEKFICKGVGFIVMSRLTTVPKTSVIIQQSDYSREKLKEIISAALQDEKHVRTVLKNEEGETLENIDNVNNFTIMEQAGFIRALEGMIETGYVHMDNHIDNLGWSGNNMRENGEEIVFDFGFTQKRNFSDQKDCRWALCFSLFQIIENCPCELLEASLIYHAATALLNNTYVWGDSASGTMIPLDNLKNFLNPTGRKQKPFIYSRKYDYSSDLELGSFAYANIIGLGLWERNNNTPYNTIYQIRNPSQYLSESH